MIDTLYPKFIIEGDRLILSKVTYHKELVTDEKQVKGGGWFRYLQHTDTFVFYGSSFDYGSPAREDIVRCVREDKVFRNKFSDESIVKDHHFALDTGTEIIPL
jgi:hypothetical protein